MMIDIDIEGAVGTFSYAFKVQSSAQSTALFGPSGSGKTTLINALAGLLRPQRGHIRINGVDYFDVSKGLDLAVQGRQIGQIFQDARLFPHLTVKRNLTYAQWAGGRLSTLNFSDVVDLLGIAHLVDRKPMSLSGGERQRVAIGRALLSDPKLLLLDEPLSALDSARKREIMPYLETLVRETQIPMIYVSHDLNEVIRLADHLVLINEGKVEAQGPINAVLPTLHGVFEGAEQNPVTLVEAHFQAIDDDFDVSILTLGDQQMVVPGRLGESARPHRVRIDARDVTLATRAPENTSIQNILKGQVVQVVEASPVLADVHLMVEGQLIVSRVTRRAVHMLNLQKEMTVWAMVKSAAIEGGVHDGRS